MLIIFTNALINKTFFYIFSSSVLVLFFFSVIGNMPPTVYGADFNFGAAGDWGCTSNTDATLTNVKAKGPERVFGLGDYSYASTGTCFF